MLVTDVSRLPERAKRELIRGENARAEFAIRAQTALQEAMGEMGPIRHIEGIGRKVACIHPELAARIRVKFGVRCLHDPDFLRRLVKKNPFLRVQTVPARLTVRVNGRKGEDGRSEIGREKNPISDLRSSISRRLEDAQNGRGHGARRAVDDGARKGDPAPPSDCSRRGVSSLLVSPGQRSGHETAARSESILTADYADATDRKTKTLLSEKSALSAVNSPVPV